MCEAYIRLHIWIEIYHPLLHCFNYPLTWYKASSDCWAKPTGIFALLLQKRKKEKKRRTKEDNFSIVLLYREYQIISLKSCLISHLCSHLVGFYLGSHLAQFSSYFCAWFFVVPRGERTDEKDSQSFLGYLTSTKLNVPSYLSKFFWKLGNMCLVVQAELLMPTGLALERVLLMKIINSLIRNDD